MSADLLRELALAKVAFQLRAIEAILSEKPINSTRDGSVPNKPLPVNNGE